MGRRRGGGGRGKGRNVVATDAGMSGRTRGDVDFDLGVLAREGGEEVGEEFAMRGNVVSCFGLVITEEDKAGQKEGGEREKRGGGRNV